MSVKLCVKLGAEVLAEYVLFPAQPHQGSLLSLVELKSNNQDFETVPEAKKNLADCEILCKKIDKISVAEETLAISKWRIMTK